MAAVNNVRQHNLYYLKPLPDAARSFIVPERRNLADGDFPTPPKDFTQYNESAEVHLTNGRAAAQAVRDILEKGGFDIRNCARFLEFGCSNGRVLRHFRDWAQTSEGWGVDMNAATLFWAMQNLRPPFHFAVTTEAPHLPFEDRFFGLVFAISIFTHIDALFPAWIAELARVTRIGGYVYLTIHDDEGSVRALKEGKAKALSEVLFQSPDFERFDAGEIAMLSVEVGVWGLLPFFKRSFFLEIMSDWFDIVSVTDCANAGYQTGVLGRRKPLSNAPGLEA